MTGEVYFFFSGSRRLICSLRSCIRNSQWTVPDTELRESLRLAVAEVLLPSYRISSNISGLFSHTSQPFNYFSFQMVCELECSVLFNVRPRWLSGCS